MTDRSTYTNWNYDVNYVELDEQKIGDKAIFILKGPEKRNIIVRLDVAIWCASASLNIIHLFCAPFWYITSQPYNLCAFWRCFTTANSKIRDIFRCTVIICNLWMFICINPMTLWKVQPPWMGSLSATKHRSSRRLFY